jgi:hypothetical protein
VVEEVVAVPVGQGVNQGVGAHTTSSALDLDGAPVTGKYSTFVIQNDKNK